MFAMFTGEGMNSFYQIIMSFPTIFFTILLIVVVVFWVLAILGAVDISILDFDIDLDADTSSLSAITGLMMRLGLHGVPFTIVLSLITIIGWLISYYAAYFLLTLVDNGYLYFLFGIPVLFGSIYAAVMITAVVIKPLRPLFKKAEQQTVKRVLGQVAIVRSTIVNGVAGEATLADGGAGLIVKIRSIDGAEFHRGDRVILLEYLPESYVYRVISEQAFLGSSSS